MKARGNGSSLKKWIDGSGLHQAEVARRLDVDRSMITHLCVGRARPSLALAIAIEKLTSGKVRAVRWTAPARKAAA